jgi:uncharacterized membrane protein YfcA
LLGFAAGLVIAVLTAPVGVSGAVFLLPMQLDVLRVPSPAVTPTNLLFCSEAEAHRTHPSVEFS